jgi:endonuclease-3
MAAAKSKSKLSAADRQKIVTRLLKQLKKEFGGLPKYEQLPVLETMIFATCLEDATFEAAQAAFNRLTGDFFDWNEVRVSTISELEPVFDGLPEPALRGHRVRGILHYVFDHQYSYDFDAIRRKTMELAQKQLAKIKYLTPFARNWLLQTALGNHVVPADGYMIRCSVWLGLVPPGTGDDTAADALKSYTRKADGPEFAWLMKSLSVSPKAQFILGMDLSPKGIEGTDNSLETADERLIDVLSGRAKRRHAAQDRASAAKKAADKEKAAAKKKRASQEKKAASQAKKVASQEKSKPASGKASTTAKPDRTAAPKKPTGSKVAKKKTTAKKTTAKKAARKKR